MKVERWWKCFYRFVPYEAYQAACEYDVCGCDMGGDCLCYCEAIYAYVKLCINFNVVINWRVKMPECRKYNVHLALLLTIPFLIVVG